MTIKTLEATVSLDFQPGFVRLCGAATTHLTKSSLNKTSSSWRQIILEHWRISRQSLKAHLTIFDLKLILKMKFKQAILDQIANSKTHILVLNYFNEEELLQADCDIPTSQLWQSKPIEKTSLLLYLNDCAEVIAHY